MAIDIKNTGLDTKLDGNVGTVDSKDLIWDGDITGQFDGELVIVYPWRTITKTTLVRSKNDDGSYKKDSDGNFIKEEVKDLTWYTTDIVFRLKDGLYDGYGVKGSLSTHPDMIGSAKRFLYAAKLFDVSLNDLKNHVGTMVSVFVKSKTDTWKDKQTGVTKTENSAYASYYDRYVPEEVAE